MKSKKHYNISENQVEDALIANTFYLRKLLNLSDNLKLIARQLRLKKGEQRLDFLLLDRKDLCLVELKITKFSGSFLTQILGYREELLFLQSQGELISGNIKSFLLITQATLEQVKEAKENNIELVVYDPLEVLKNYYQNLSVIAPFLNIKPNDYGVFNLVLMNRTLIQLSNGKSTQAEISKIIKLSKGSVHNHLKVAKDFGLVRERNKNYFLTDLGDQYLFNINKEILIERLNHNQIETLKKFIAKDPFYSSSVFGIYSIVESAFILARNSYPIEFSELSKVFQIISGKVNEWQANRALSTATYTFMNFAIDLDLLGKIGKKVVITPAGFRFILMLQLHKSIEMIEGLST
ncbi:MAG: hypothetical protein ABI550_08040 [Ignavibacteriaceae bacterium]